MTGRETKSFTVITCLEFGGSPLDTNKIFIFS